MRAFPFLAAFGLAILGGPAAALAQIAGPAVVIDGDTLDIGQHRLRLFGLDAPETGQACGDASGADWDCGAAAQGRLEELVAAPDLTCVAVERDGYDRIVARCFAGGIDINETLVSEGLAWAYTRFSAAYSEVEAEARAAGRGIWQGTAQTAWDWRQAGEWRAASGEVAPEGCTIKGNVNRHGDRIYHTADSPWYERIRIDPARGQRWFCDAAEAEAAGWRPVAGSR